MANESANPNISEIQTKNGSVYDVAAKRFSGNRTIEFNGDVTANETGWDGSGKLEVSTTISDGAVGEGKIADSAVTNAKVADGAVNWDKIASSVKNGTIAGNYTEKLATCAQVKTYVDEAITGHGSYLGQKSVAEVNALTGMNNGDHVSVSNAGSITNPDGSSTSVNAGDNVIYDGTLRKWDCLAGDYKVKQTAKELENTDSTKTISKVTQNENGEVSFTYQTIGKVSSATTADVSNTLAHARNLKVDLSSANAQSFDGSGDADSIGVSGKLADSNIASSSTWNAKQDVIQSSLTQVVPVNVQGYFYIDCIDRHQTYMVKLEQNGLNSVTFLYRSYWSGAGIFAKLTCLQSQTRDIVAYNEIYTPEGGSVNSSHRVYFKIPISASNSNWYFTTTKVGNSIYNYMPTPRYTTELPENATLIPCEYLQTEDNEVTSWSSTTSDKKYPSEKLVKDSLDLKANSSDVYTKTEVDAKANDSEVVHKTGNEVINDLKTFKKTIQINTDGTDDNAGVNLSSKGGQVNFVSGSSKRGLYLGAHGTGSAGWALEIDTNNVVTLNGKATSVTKELTASDIDALWAE